jgi:HEAT repeats
MRMTLKSLIRAIVVFMFLVAVVDSESNAAPLPELSGDGWHSWRVKDIDSDSVRCCVTWSQGKAIARGCNLDTGRMSIIGSDSPVQTTDELQIYAYTEAGNVTKIRALSPQCPVEAQSEIEDLGLIENADSVSWLTAYVTPHSKLSEDAIAAIARHAGDESFAVLRDTVRSDRNAENRKQAVFWMAETGRQQSEAEIERAIARDRDSAVREHAEFALSLLPDERGIDGLIAVLENRRYKMNVPHFEARTCLPELVSR